MKKPADIEADPIASLIWDWGSQSLDELTAREPKWISTPNEILIARYLREHGIINP